MLCTLLAGCSLPFPFGSGSTTTTAVPVNGGACGGNGDSIWPVQQPETYPINSTRDGSLVTGTNVEDGYNSYVEVTGGLDIQSGGTIQGCIGADNETSGHGDGPVNWGIVANLSHTACGGCIQAYPKFDARMDDFNRSNGDFDGNPNSTPTPVVDVGGPGASCSDTTTPACSLTYSYTLPTGSTTINGTTYTVNDLTNGDWEFSPDIWPSYNCGSEGSNDPDGSNDLMIWDAISDQRRAENYGGMTSVLSSITIEGQTYTIGKFGPNAEGHYEWVFANHANVMARTNVNVTKDYLPVLEYLGAWAPCSTAKSNTTADGHTTSGSNVISTATLLHGFGPWKDATITDSLHLLPSGTKVTGFPGNDAQSATLSANATGTATNDVFTVTQSNPLSFGDFDPTGFELAGTSSGGSPYTTQAAQAYQVTDTALIATAIAG